MREIARSIYLFCKFFLRHYYFWLFALLLNPIDLYGRFKLPDWPSLPIPKEAQVAIAVVLILVSIIAAFHDARLMVPPKPQADMPLDEAIRYIAGRSIWLVVHNGDQDKLRSIARDLRDALSLGELHAFGRPTIGSHGVIPDTFDKPLASIPVDVWPTHLISVIGPLSGESIANTLYSIEAKRTAYYDIFLSRSEVMSRWHPIYLRRLLCRPLRYKTLANVEVASKEEHERLVKTERESQFDVKNEDRIRL